MVALAKVKESSNCSSDRSCEFRSSSKSPQISHYSSTQTPQEGGATYNFANTPLNAAQVPLATAKTIHALRLSSFIFAASDAGQMEEYKGGASPSSGSSASAASSLIGRMAAVRLASWSSWEVAVFSATRRRSEPVERGEDMTRVGRRV